MAEYKAPETRILVKTKEGHWKRYYPQFKAVYIPLILSEWNCIRGDLLFNEDYTLSLEDAQGRIDKFLVSDKDYHEEIERKKAAKKVRVKYEYLKYH